MQQMMKEEMKVNIRDLVFHLLYRWRSIVIVALIAALLLLGVQYLQMNSETAAETWRQDMEEYREAQLIYETSTNNLKAAIESSMNQINALRDYQEHSILISINPWAEWRATNQYSILLDAEAGEPTSDIARQKAEDALRVLYGTIDNGLDAEKIIQLTGASEEQYARELIGVSYESNALENAVITVTVRGDSEDMVRQVMQYLETVMAEENRSTGQQIAAHQLMLINADVRLIVDSNLKTRQEELEAKIRSLQTGIQADQKALAGLSEPSEPDHYRMGVKTAIKYALIGAFLGAVAMIGIYIFSYVLGGKLHTAEDFRERYGIPVYGDFVHSRARKPGKGIDRLLEKKEFERDRVDERQLLEGIGTLIRKNTAGKELLLTGTISKEKLDSLREKLTGVMKEFSISAEPDFIHNPGAISASKDAAYVLLVEEKYTTRIREIDREAEMLAVNGTTVSGFIGL